MRTRSFAVLAATAALVLAACGDDDEGAGASSTQAVVTTTTVAPAAVETTEAVVETTEAAVETTEAAVETTEAAVETTAVETTEAAVETTEAAVETTEAAVETTEAAVETTEAAVETTEAAVETTEAAVETTEAAVETTEAAVETTEAAVETTEAAVETTEAAVETTEAAVETTEAAVETTEAAVETTEAPATTAPAGDLGEIAVGSANFPESELLAQIYGQALEAAGYDVSYELAIGAREAYYGAVEGGEVDLVPEYTGSLLSFLLAPEQPDAANVDEQVAALGETLPEGLEVLTPSSAEDKDTIVCTQDVVDELGLTNLASLFENSASITLGAPPEFETRTPFGLAGFTDLFGAEFEEFVPLAYGDIAAALEGGQIDCGNIFSTDPAISTGGFVTLSDDDAIVPNEAVLPLVRSDVVGPELTAVLDDINANLDTDTLSELVARVVNDQIGADVVAAEFLETLGG